MKGRRWTDDEDYVLKDKVLRYIRSGKSQLDAFEEVGKQLNRTPGACGFRWNAVLREKYLKAYHEAKKTRVRVQLERDKSQKIKSITEAIHHLKQYELERHTLITNIEDLSKKIEDVEQERQQLLLEKQALSGGKKQLKWQQEGEIQPYQNLLKLLEWLKKMEDKSENQEQRNIKLAVSAETIDKDRQKY
ncbi:hypothetical protein IC620_00885 [Hazenella sp. IB182357]|uniref:Myb-like domain-containing protein n=1 Tax=Polycladospora coralii TaxID=2771432 RepID=A0A926N5I4_9BACL|nr:hypothetical protein [Polycladospora coralii]MBD1370916.1 hypothetical protein [Polycladospora coralii]MBS7529855.1 hypothetical protein [Polycladospora coralii]